MSCAWALLANRLGQAGFFDTSPWLAPPKPGGWAGGPGPRAKAKSMMVSQTMAVPLSARRGAQRHAGKEEANRPVGEEADDARVSEEATRDQPWRRS